MFSPSDFIYILNKLKNEFGFKRMSQILATGNQGTLKGYYLKDSSFIFAKTGTLSNNIALSGYLITDKGKILIFSVLINHFPGPATPARKAIQAFIEQVKKDY